MRIIWLEYPNRLLLLIIFIFLLLCLIVINDHNCPHVSKYSDVSENTGHAIKQLDMSFFL